MLQLSTGMSYATNAAVAEAGRRVSSLQKILKKRLVVSWVFFLTTIVTQWLALGPIKVAYGLCNVTVLQNCERREERERE